MHTWYSPKEETRGAVEVGWGGVGYSSTADLNDLILLKAGKVGRHHPGVVKDEELDQVCVLRRPDEQTTEFFAPGLPRAPR